MPAELGWLVAILGLVALAACWWLPREIGKEDEPVVDVHIDLPSIEDLALRLRRPRPAFRRSPRYL